MNDQPQVSGKRRSVSEGGNDVAQRRRSEGTWPRRRRQGEKSDRPPGSEVWASGETESGGGMEKGFVEGAKNIVRSQRQLLRNGEGGLAEGGK